MAKSVILTQNTEVIYPQTVPSQVVDPSTGRSVQELMDISIDGTIAKVVTTLPSTNIKIGLIYLIETSTAGTYTQWVFDGSEWLNKGDYTLNVNIVNNLVQGGVDSALSAEQGKILNEKITYRGYSASEKVTGKQSYGTVGNTISIGTLAGAEYMKVLGPAEQVRFTTLVGTLPSSYIQYVDDNDTIISLDFTNYTQGTTYTYSVNYPNGATGFYITGANNSIEIIKGVREQSIKEYIGEKDELPASDKTSLVSSLLELLQVDSSSSRTYTLAQAQAKFLDNKYNNKLIAASSTSIGNTPNTTNAQGYYSLSIPLSGLESVSYPMFKTTEGYGSVAIDDNEIVVWVYANYAALDDTIKTVNVSDLNGASRLLITYSSSMTNGIILSYPKNPPIPINDYVLNEMPSDNYMGDSTVKVLNLKGASDLYTALVSLIGNGGNAGGMDCFNDFGIMPSCIQGDTGAFLEDGLIDSNTAIIKYSDVIAKYDALVSKYPNYVTKTSVGNDASGSIPMYYYTFTPKYWKQSIYLQAGVHGWEPDPIYALAEIMYLIANAYGTSDASDLYIPNNNPLKYLRGNVKITVFPVVNPWGFNNRGDCGLDKRSVAQNNYNNVQLNGSWGGGEPEAVYVRTLVESLANELSFAIDMHSTVWPDSRTRYGCFYGGVNQGAENVRTIYRTYEWLYQFYNVKYPLIVQGNQCPNPLGGGYASVGYMTNTFNSYFYANYNIQASTMEFSDHTWTPELHTSVALSVAVNMYLNQIIQQLNDEYNHNSETGIPAGEMYPAKG